MDQREIVAHFDKLKPVVVPPSLALVNKVVQHLRDEALLKPLPNLGFRVRDYEGLLQLWRRHYRFDHSARRRYFTLLQNRVLNARLSALGTSALDAIAYSAFSAAELQAPHVRQARTWLYLTADMEEEFKWSRRGGRRSHASTAAKTGVDSNDP